MRRMMLAAGWLALVPALTFAAEPAPDGATIFAASGCPSCHGAEGRKPLAATPALAGQNAAYLERQLSEIADGTRTNPAAKPMRPFVQKLGPDQRKMLALWLAGRDPTLPTAGDAAKVVAGAELFEDNGCVGCHGGDGLKPLADYPILAGQRPDYLGAQMRAIRDEVRSTRRARLMVANVRMLKDDQIEQIAAFLSQVKRK